MTAIETMQTVMLYLPSRRSHVLAEADLGRVQHQRREERGADQASDHHGGQQLLHRSAGPGRKRHGQEAQRPLLEAKGFPRAAPTRACGVGRRVWPAHGSVF